MSDFIPFEMQHEIIKRLPHKSLIRCRSVSKPWKSLIDSSPFITHFGAQQTQPPRLLATHDRLEDGEASYVSITDDENLSKHEFTFDSTIKPLKVIGSSHGLLCYYREPIQFHVMFTRPVTAVLRNPSIRKSVSIVLPGVLGFPYETVIGFGVCPVTSDPTLVKITFVSMIGELKSRSWTPWNVQIFTLSSGSWSNLTNNLPRETIKVTMSQVVIDRFIYWLGYDMFIAANGNCFTKSLIMSFDLTTREFKVVDLPDMLGHHSFPHLSISKIQGSLAVIKYSETRVTQVCEVFMMEDDGVTKSFKKLFTINTPYSSSIKILGFRGNGQAIMETKDYETAPVLEVYDPSSGQLSNFKIFGQDETFFVCSYMETLLLLDQLDGHTYSNIISDGGDS